MSKLKIAFIPTNVSGVVFYRAWQPYLALKSYKKANPIIWWYAPDQFHVHPWVFQLRGHEMSESIINDIEMAVKWADVVVWMGLQTFDSLNLFRKLKNLYGKTFITEIDDYILSIPEKNEASRQYKPGGDLIRVGMAQLKESDGVICSTPYLKTLYSAFNRNIEVVENVIDLSLWNGRAKDKNKEEIVIGWVGGATHEGDLALIKNVIIETVEKNKNVFFKCVHGVPSFFKNHPKIRWTGDFMPIDKYPKWVVSQGFDIGVAPLVDNNFNRGKSNLRWLEYSALRKPTLASPLPHFQKSIVHGATGFICSSELEWKEQLQALINEPSLRENVGKAAKKEVATNWSIEQLGQRYYQALERIINARTDPNDSPIPGGLLNGRPE